MEKTEAQKSAQCHKVTWIFEVRATNSGGIVCCQVLKVLASRVHAPSGLRFCIVGNRVGVGWGIAINLLVYL